MLPSVGASPETTTGTATPVCPDCAKTSDDPTSDALKKISRKKTTLFMVSTVYGKLNRSFNQSNLILTRSASLNTIAIQFPQQKNLDILGEKKISARVLFPTVKRKFQYYLCSTEKSQRKKKMNTTFGSAHYIVFVFIYRFLASPKMVTH